MSDAPIRVEMTWSPALLKEVSYLNLTAEGSTDGKRQRRMKILLSIAIAAILLLLFGPVQGVIPRSLLWFALGLLVMRAAVTFIHIPAMNRRRIARAMSSPLAQGPRSLTLSGKGIIVEQAVSYTAYDWNAVVGIQEQALALHLLVGDALSVPVPFDALPGGLTRDDLQQRVGAWRTAAAQERRGS